MKKLTAGDSLALICAACLGGERHRLLELEVAAHAGKLDQHGRFACNDSAPTVFITEIARLEGVPPNMSVG